MVIKKCLYISHNNETKKTVVVSCHIPVWLTLLIDFFLRQYFGFPGKPELNVNLSELSTIMMG